MRRWKEFQLHGRFTWWLLEGQRIVADVSTFWKSGAIRFLASIRLKKNKRDGREILADSFECLEDAKRWVMKHIPPTGRLYLFLENERVKPRETVSL